MIGITVNMDEELPYRILNLLRELYVKDPTSFVGIDYFDVFEHSQKEIQGALIYLKEKEWIKSFQGHDGEWVQRINAKGMDEINNSDRISREDYEKNHPDDDKLLDLEVSHEEHTGKIKVFISHKFVESDQKLAQTLENNLNEHNIYGYLAERKKEYDIVFGEKIKKEINSSDYLIAIITKNSHLAPSVHQEIGYAIGIGIPVRIMAEEQEVKGVLVEGKDIENFSRNNFEKSLGNIIKDIQKNSIRKKLTDKQKEDLIEKVYAPCYDGLVKLTLTSRETPLGNPWGNISPALKLNTEQDVKILFEEFSRDVESWNAMLTQIESDFTHQEVNLASILESSFLEARLINNFKDIQLDDKTSTSLLNWFKVFRYVLIDPTITDSHTLYEKLHEYSILNKNGHAKWLKQFAVDTSLFSYMINWLPDIRREFNSKIKFEELDRQREKLLKNYEKLFHTLEEKISQ